MADVKRDDDGAEDTPVAAGRRTYAVFISSTFIDNEERRQTVEDAVIRAGMQAVGMERFTASSHPTVDECCRLAGECDVYVGIVAHRYGWIPDGRDVSITEMEYDAAKEAGRPRFMFHLDASVLVDPTRDFDTGPGRGAKQDKLDAFRAKVAADQMPAPFTETRLGAKVLHALMTWRAETEAAKQPQPPAADHPAATVAPDVQAIAGYRATVEALYSKIELAGFKTRLRVPIDLEELYVPLHAMINRSVVGETDLRSADEAERHLREAGAGGDLALVNAFTELASQDRRGLVLLGDPGSGKTTHLKRLLLWCLRNGPETLGLPEGVVPVLLPLRRLRDPSAGLDAFVAQVIGEDVPDAPPDFAQRLLRRGKLLLLLDGLDEVADGKQRAAVSQWIEQAAATRRTCTVVVTCRFAGYAGKARLGTDFLELHVRPLTREQADAFIRTWYRAVETGLRKDAGRAGETRLEAKAEELVARLREPDFRMARLVEMTRNPLLLTNLCLVHFDRGQLPRGRARLYEECVDVLLERWRGEVRDLPLGVTTEDGRRVLQPAALWMHEQEGRTLASADELTPVLEPALEVVKWKGGSAREFLRTVRDESGLLTGWGHDQYGFMHLGFQEYLAAAEIRRRYFEEGDAKALRDLAGRYGTSWWQEVMLLLVAQGNPSAFAPFMREVIARADLANRPELLDAILEDATGALEAPFVELLERDAGRDAATWARQLVALRVLERLKSPYIDALAKRLARHPSPLIQQWLRDRTIGAAAEAVTDNGGIELVRIPGGTFTMGSPEDEKGRVSWEGPQHEVTLQPFLIGKYLVTNEQYARFLEANPKAKEPAYWGHRQFNQARQPVVGVDWGEARGFAEWAGCRLPSEAEWEYAARAVTTAPYLDGASEEHLDRHAWYGRNAGGQTHPVGEKAANAWGLHDVLGNAWEWVEDDWHGRYKGAPRDGSAWVDEPRAADRVYRGGSWATTARGCRVAYRVTWHPAYGLAIRGFRVARS